MGGTSRNPIISALYEALPGAERFDFASSDLAVARQQTLDALGDGPTWLVGYSFGGGIAAMVDDPRVAGWYLVAPALSMVEPVIGADNRPKRILAAERDQFFPPSALAAATADWTAVSHDTLGGADHFFGGHAAAVAERCVAWLTG